MKRLVVFGLIFSMITGGFLVNGSVSANSTGTKQGYVVDNQEFIKKIGNKAKEQKVMNCQFQLGTSTEDIKSKWKNGYTDEKKDGYGILTYKKKGIQFWYDEKQAVYDIHVDKNLRPRKIVLKDLKSALGSIIETDRPENVIVAWHFVDKNTMVIFTLEHDKKENQHFVTSYDLVKRQ